MFTRHDRAALAFSGGKESLVMLELLQPWRARVTLLWVNTGAMFPHMVEFVRGFGREWRLVELTGDLVAHLRAHGLPANIVPLRHATGGHAEPLKPKLQPYIFCCAAVRTKPIVDFMGSGPSS